MIYDECVDILLAKVVNGMPLRPRANDDVKAAPFLKWAGGKAQLLLQFDPFFPREFDRYFEPFLGSGAVFFHLAPKEACLFDSNCELVNVYCAVRDEVDSLVTMLKHHKRRHSKEYYYSVRSLKSDPLSSVERAARVLYLNKTCFNGLYRVNSKGQFNVPMGKYDNPSICNEEALRAAHSVLQGKVLKVMDFRDVRKLVRPGDFVYFDPPYHPLNPTSSFTSYAEENFGESDQRDLAECIGELTDMGVMVMASNSDCRFTRTLYEGLRPAVSVLTVHARRAINSDPAKRGRISELLVLNYPVQEARVANDSTRSTSVALPVR